MPAQNAVNTATPVSTLGLPPGFKAELLRSAQSDEGSWICLTVDAKGRLIISPEKIATQTADGKPSRGGLLRVTLSAAGQVERWEKIAAPVGAAMGLLYAFDSLYVSGQGPDGTGLYRLRDTNGDGEFDEVKLLKKFEGAFRTEAAGEHGPHALVLGPDKMLYLMHGNETKLPADLSAHSPHRNFQEDQLLPPQHWPENFTWANGPPPGGCVLRTDPDGKEWTLVCGGLRNAYDLAFNRDGEMFTFDSDMDWDDGAPWYRPTRINHLVSGGEYGWRKGTGKWPDYYPDSLRSNLDVGRSSPTGMKFGSGSQLPSKYQRALFLCDWAFGTIYAAHFIPNGATYKITVEPFVTGRPLNVTDLEFGADGAMYFITGGRGTQSGLYRVTYELPKVRDPVVVGLAEISGAKSRALRHKLEAFHGKTDPAAVDFVWPHLNSDDRWIRYAARIALEAQPVAQWQARALAETNSHAGITALLALARCGGPACQDDLLKALAKFPLDSLNEEQKLDKLRVISLSFIRQGKPGAAMRTMGVEKLSRQFPASSARLNRELCQLLVYLEAPDMVEKTMKLLAAAPTQEEQMQYVFALRLVRQGWTPELRAAYFNWFPEAAKNYTGSHNFLGFLANTRDDASRTLTDAERVVLAPLLAKKIAEPPPVAPQRAFVKEWTMEDMTPLLNQVSRGRSFRKGQEAFAAAQCVLCHRFGHEGGVIGPDLTTAASRFSRRDMLEAILLPSKVIPDQFQNTDIITRDGVATTGRVLEENAIKLVVATNPLAPERVEILKLDIKARRISALSPMPEGLVNILSKEELLDMLAFLESGGKTDYSAFRP